MFGEMERDGVFGYLHVQRRSRLETMFPVDREPEKIDVEFPRLRFVEDPENGNGVRECHDGLLVIPAPALQVFSSPWAIRLRECCT